MDDHLRPLTIADVRCDNNLVLSPMAGFTDLPFRVLCRRHGAGLVSSEMVAAVGLEHNTVKARQRMASSDDARPNCLQLAGTDPEQVAWAAREAETDAELLGFNMGCPAHQIKRIGCGAALLDKRELAGELVRAVKSASKLGLVVKIRAGNRGPMDMAAFAHTLEDAGADAIIVHGRTAAQAYRGFADWATIRAVKEAVSIPVIGNGDVVDGPSAARAFEASGVDGLAIGRASLGDPRLFARIAAYLQDGTVLEPPTPVERVEDALAWLAMAEPVGLHAQHRVQQVQRFTKGIRGAARVRARVRPEAIDVPTVRRVLETMLAGLDEHHRRERPEPVVLSDAAT